MQELRPGLWTWTARHPDWTPEQGGPDGWEPDVRSYAYDAGEILVLFDPLVPAEMFDELSRVTLNRDVAILLTYNGHERSSGEITERFTATVYAPAVSRSPLSIPSTPFSVGDTLPGEVAVQTGFYPNEATFWIEGHRALVAGDILLGGGDPGVRTPPESWLAPGLSSDDLKRGLRPLLALPIELLLLAHADPVTAHVHQRLAAALAVAEDESEV